MELTPADTVCALLKVGHALLRVVLARMRLLLATDVQASAQRPTLTQAQQCLAQWEKLIRWRFASSFEAVDEVRKSITISVRSTLTSSVLRFDSMNHP